MAFTTSARLQDLIGAEQGGFHSKPNADALTAAAAGANAELEKLGVPSTETDAGLLQAADRLALSYLLEGLIVQMALRRESQATGSLRITALEMRASALQQAGGYVSLTVRKPKVVRNRNWAYGRGGPLRRGSEAGKYKRTDP